MLMLLGTVLAILTVEMLYLANFALNVSAVTTTSNLGVYWDSKHTNRVASINWGNITAGTTKTVKVYVRNEGNDSIVLVFTPSNWNPSTASLYLALSGSYDAAKLLVGQIVPVTLALKVAPAAYGISAFSFSIIVEGRKYYLGDVNRDGTVDLKDYFQAAKAYGTSPGMPNWNPYADLDGNSVVNLKDIFALMLNFGL